ncbi:MFS transporter [Paenibacillus sediminis]|uniref:PPP family 3-phenylpropionic acid transporter n=1 Tax=Paenibacillus sediminis TaxID=664909 RepID=A0ABS4H5F6_9BACL|nr:MFS transporter [Paenibacillus sediminis]MBP1937756.1 PPP family 3-phenylpropionic acid transporter [Paenibacillus sediminis]
MNQRSEAHAEQNWLRAFTFMLFGNSVLVVSFFPLFYSHIGFSSSQIGLLYAIGPLISIFSNMFWSIASDRYKTIKKILIILTIGQLIMALVLYTASSFAVVFVVISFLYFFYYPAFPLTDTLSIVTAHKYGRNFTVIRIFGSIGYAFFALTVGYILTNIGTTWTIAICAAITFTALLFAFKIKDQPGSVNKMDLSGLWGIIRSKEVLLFFIFVFCLALGHRMNEAFLTIALHDLGSSEGIVGWALVMSSLSEIPVFFLLSKYGDKFKELPLIAFASFMYAVRFLLMSLTDSPIGIVFIQGLHSLTFGIFYVTAVRYLSRIIPPDFRATGMALYTIAWSSASGLLSGTFGGIIYEHVGRSDFYLVAVAFSIVAFIGFLMKHLFIKETIS